MSEPAHTLHDHSAGAPAPRFCERCATVLQDGVVEDRPLPVCSACGFVAYRDPKVVAVAVLDAGDDSVWLIRRAIAPGIGEWALPGGYVDADEHPRAAARRECLEEIGCEVLIDALVTVEHAAVGLGGVVVVAYSGRIVAGDPARGPEVLEVARHPAARPPPVAFATHAAILRAYVGGDGPGPGRGRSD